MIEINIETVGSLRTLETPVKGVTIHRLRTTALDVGSTDGLVLVFPKNMHLNFDMILECSSVNTAHQDLKSDKGLVF